MCAKCQAKLMRGRAKAWLLEVAVGLLRGQLHSMLLSDAAALSANAHAIDPAIVS